MAQDGMTANAAQDGDDTQWVPLHASSGAGTRDESNADQNWSSGNLRSVVVVPSSTTTASDVESTSARENGSHSNAQSLRAIQQRLETKKALKEELVDRSVNHFAGKFIVHLFRELWYQDYYLRCGM